MYFFPCTTFIWYLNVIELQPQIVFHWAFEKEQQYSYGDTVVV